MDVDDYAELMREIITEAENVVGEDADDDTKGEYIIGVSTDDVGALVEYLMSVSHQSIFQRLIVGDVGGAVGISPTELIRMTIESTVPTTWAIARRLAARKRTGSEYMAALESEITLNSAIENGADVTKIWSPEIVDHLVQTFPDPRQAFLAGVLCGKSHG